LRGDKVTLTIPILNIRLRLSFWFFALIALFLLLDRRIILLYIALPVIVHELGHIIVMAFCKVKITEISLTPVSVRIIAGSPVLSYRKELAIAAGGIAANLIIALLWRLFAFQSMRVMLIVASNLAVAAFNLLPVGNLDGGRIVRILCARCLSPGLASAISKLISFAVLVPLSAIAAFLLLRGNGNFTLALVCAYLFLIVARNVD